MKNKKGFRKTAEAARKPQRRGRRGNLGLPSLVNLAKEIRTPLDSLQALNRSLQETNPSPEQQECIDKFRASTDALLTLVNDLYDYSRIEAGKLPLARMNFDLRTTVEDTVQMLALRAGEKGLKMGCLIHHQVPSLLLGDPGRLRQILVNLTHLAFRYTEKGEILIQVTLEKESKTRALIHFAVMNTGEGIPPAHRARLFDYPSRSGISGKKMWEGSDIGLALSKKLAEKMGGKIGVESEKQKGATFWFTVLLRKQKVNGVIPWFDPQALRGKRVLIVDEQPGSRQAMEEQLRGWGCTPDVAAGGREAMVRLCQAVEDRSPYALAVVSKEMEEVDGISLARQIKSSPVLSETILVLLASQGDRGEGRLMQEIGVTGYLTKPVKTSQLRECLGLALSRKAHPAGFSAVPLITRHSLAEEKKRRVRILVVSQDIQDQGVALQTLRNIGYAADAVAQGSEALAAIAETPYDLVLMDAELPEMDGPAATAAVRQKEKETGRHIHIIGITPLKSDQDRERCLRAGMDDYIPKPVRAVDLADVMERFLADAD